MRKIVLACASFLTVMLLAGCLYRDEEPAAGANASVVADPKDDPPPVATGIPGRNQPSKDGTGFGPAKKSPIDLPEPKLDDEDIPTGILLATCDSSPTEVALPLNAADGKLCDTVTAYPYREDANGAYLVDGSVVAWSLPQQEVASFAGPATGYAGNTRRLAALTDVFWSADGDVEPETQLTVCVEPPEKAPHAFQPLCRSLPVRDVANIEGAWCFSGATFEGDCHDVTILQDGRLIYTDDDALSDGLVRARSIEFNRDNDYLYDGVLESHDYLYGIVRVNGSNEILGTWTAWRLPLF